MEKALTLLVCLMVMVGCSSTGQKTQLYPNDEKQFVTEYRQIEAVKNIDRSSTRFNQDTSFNGYAGFKVIKASSYSSALVDALSSESTVKDEDSEEVDVEVVVAENIATAKNISTDITDKLKISKSSINPTYMLQKGETLLQVAEKLNFPKENISRAVVAIWINNMEKFVDGNINGVYKGMVLDTTDLEARVQQMDISTARKIVKKQKRQWVNFEKSKNSNQEFVKMLPVAPAPENQQYP